MVPLVETPEEAARAVAACRFPPLGRRSMGPIRAMTTMASDRPTDLNQVACIIQVETALGLRNVDAIAATPGLTGIFIGPSDLAISLGLDELDPAAQPKREEAHATILAACQRRGIVTGIITSNGTQAARRLEQGFRLVALTSDLALIIEGGTHELGVARAGEAALSRSLEARGLGQAEFRSRRVAMVQPTLDGVPPARRRDSMTDFGLLTLFLFLHVGAAIIAFGPTRRRRASRAR